MIYYRSFLIKLMLLVCPLEAMSQIEVVYFISPTCKICQFYALEMRQLVADYGLEVEFKAYAVGALLTDSAVQSFKSDYQIPFPVIMDDIKHRELNATITPEVFVIDNTGVVYHGRIDDSFVRVGKRRAHVKNRELRSVLDLILAGKQVVVSHTPAVGCIIEK